MRLAVLVLLGVSMSACSGGDADLLRQAWLVDGLVRDNAVWLPGREEALQAKYEKMAADPYNFMRGSLSLALADSARPSGQREPNVFLEVQDARSVLLVVDPHPENMGTFLPGVQAPPDTLGEPVHLVAELNDLDSAQHGPWTWDVRRAALGVALILWQAECDPDCRAQVITRMAEAYGDEISRRAVGDVGWVSAVDPEGAGPLSALTRRATDRGIRRDKLERFTDRLGSDRRIDFESADLPEGQSLEWVEDAEFERLKVWLDLLNVPGPVQRHHLAKRRGQGVASLPADRYLWVSQWGQSEESAWRLLTIREVVDPPEIPNSLPGWVPKYADNSQRLLEAARGLWSRADADGHFGAATDGPVTFKLVSAGSFVERLDSTDLVDSIHDAVNPEEEMALFAEDVGRLLASSHARGTSASGRSALLAIDEDLAGRQGLLMEQVRRDAEVDLQRVLADYALFLDALDTLGPILGHDWL